MAAVGGARERPVGTRVGVVAASSDVIRLLPAKTSVSCACARNLQIGLNLVVTPNRQVCVTELAPGFVSPVPCRLRAWSVTELAPGFVSPVPCRLRVHARMHGRNHTNTHTQTHTHTHTQGSSSAIRLHWNRGRNHTHTHTHKQTHTHTQTHTHRGPAAK